MPMHRVTMRLCDGLSYRASILCAWNAKTMWKKRAPFSTMSSMPNNAVGGARMSDDGGTVPATASEMAKARKDGDIEAARGAGEDVAGKDCRHRVRRVDDRTRL